MKKKSSNCVLPKDTIIGQLFGKIDYQDCYSVSICNPHDYSVDYLTQWFFSSTPGWVHRLMTLRNLIVSFFGLKGGNIDKTEIHNPSVFYPKGSKIAIFTVYDRNDHEIVMAEDDKHLNFRTSIMIEKDKDKDPIRLYLSTIVQYNNIWGRFYFMFVKPFHQSICKTMLKILLQNTEV
jgi:hypothetical protein